MRNFVFNAAVVQLALLVLAVILRVADRSEFLVAKFALDRPEAPPIGEGGFADALRHHKLTYYVSAVLVALALVGLVGLVQSCKRICRDGALRNDACNCCYWYCLFCRGNGCPELRADSAPASCAVFGALAALVLLVAGAFFVVMGAVTWVQRVVQAWMQAVELGALASEFIVKDLSEGANYQPPHPETAPQEQLQAQAPDQRTLAMTVEHMDGVQGHLWDELQAVYGTDDHPASSP